MRDMVTQSTLLDNKLAFEMFCLNRKIEETNEASECNTEEYLFELKTKRQSLLNQYYQYKFGNVVCLR